MARSSPKGGTPPSPGPDVAGPAFVYPLDYTFKVMGLAADDFAEYARRLVAQVVGQVAAENVVVRASPKGRYHSVSVEVRLVSEEQRRAVYQVLWEDERIVYYL